MKQLRRAAIAFDKRHSGPRETKRLAAAESRYRILRITQEALGHIRAIENRGGK
jgi:hypothetical protein